MAPIKKVTFIGVGNMGNPMAGQLVAKEFEVTVFDARAETAHAFVRQHGGTAAATLAIAGAGAEAAATGAGAGAGAGAGVSCLLQAARPATAVASAAACNRVRFFKSVIPGPSPR